MVIEASGFRIFTKHLELVLASQVVKIDTPTDRITVKLIVAFLVGKEHGPFALGGCTTHKLGGHERLAGAGGSRNQHDGILEEASATHFVQIPAARTRAPI